MTFKKTLLAAAMLVTVAAPAFAAEQAWHSYKFWDWDGAYVSAKGGWTWQSDEHFSDGTKADMDGKYTVNGAVGYQIANGIRGEAEVGYKKADVNSVFTRGVGSIGSDAENKTLTLMANGYYDLNFQKLGLTNNYYANMFTPYVGAGVGAAHVRFDNYSPELAGQSPDDTDWVFAYQAMAGVSINFTPNISMMGEYRFFDTTNAQFHGQGASVKSNELLAGVKFKY